ncbi:uncharacterized protein LOC114303655 [Camellia sinensis]|uniref:uncharacterized protein LOC114303655 n=1 Tax=Camellia sinensis TaxID=4442 RepID=UPI001036552F|nr:uncharacterized protein LOC114303655 [Camellia sinensis]
MGEEEEEQILERLRNQPIYSPPPPSPSSGEVFLISPQFFFSQPPPLSPQLHFSPPPTASVLMSPYLDFSPPPPLSPQLHFSPPPTASVLMSPYLDFSPPPVMPTLEYALQNVRGLKGQIEWVPGIQKLSVFTLTDTRYLRLIILKVAVDVCDGIHKLDLWFQPYPQTQRVRSSPWRIVLTDKGDMGQCHSSKPLKRSLEDSPQDFGGALDVIPKFIDQIPWWWRRLLKLESGCDEEPDDFEEMTQTLVLESIPLVFFLPPKSPKMVPIWSCLSVVKISRKISIRLLQVLPSVQLPQTLHIVIVEEKMTQLLSCSGEFISQDSSLVEERSVEITVEVDATNNGAHGVKAYGNFPIVSHSENKNTRDKLKRNYKSISVITQKDLEQNFGRSREDVANSFGVSVSTMKRICRKHGISRWPFQPERKKERSMEVISPSMHEKHDSRLRCIRTPLHVRSSPRTIDLLDGGEMVQLDSSKQQSLVEFDVTNNSAHLVRASQSCSTISHSDETNSRETLKRKCTSKSVLSFEDLQPHFDCKRDNAAKALGVSVSTVKRICRQHGISRWPSRKKKNVSKTDYRLVEPQGEKDVSPTCSKMPTDGQTERGNEMVGHLQDQNKGLNLSNTENGSIPVFEMDSILLGLEGEKNVSPTYKTPTVGIVLDCKEVPNLSNIENHSNEESTTASIFQDSVPVFERDCVLHEPQGEKNESPTHKTPTNGQTEVGNGMVGHIQDQNGIVLEFIKGPNLLNAENCSNEKSLTIPNFQDSVPGTYPAMDSSISSIYRESGEAGGSSELAFQPNELIPSMAYPNPNACVHTEPHISLTEMPIENVGSSRDSRNFSTSAVGIFMGGHVSESSWTMPLPSNLAPMQTMATIPHTMQHHRKAIYNNCDV